MLRKEAQFGMLGCWIFMPQDWDETLAQHNIITLSGERVFRCIGIQGQSFLVRRDYMLRYYCENGYGLPLDQLPMSIDGLINGYPLPLLYAHNMDDPRSPLNVKTKGILNSDSALSARMRGFTSAAEYAKWIADDAYCRQQQPFKKQLQLRLLARDRSLLGRIKRKLYQQFAP